MNKLEKQAFVKAIMADVPQVDYESQIRKRVEKAVYDAAPPEIKAVLDKPELHKYLGPHSVYYSRENRALYTIGATSNFRCDCTTLDAAHVEQARARKELETKLTSAIAGMTTRKQIATAFPEFEKYLPAEPAKSTNLPALTDVVNQVKAAGWPKGNKMREEPDFAPHLSLDMSAEQLETLATSTNALVRKAVAGHPNTTPQVLDKLAADNVTVVRWLVADNQNTAQETLKRLLNDSAKFVANEARHNYIGE